MSWSTNSQQQNRNGIALKRFPRVTYVSSLPDRSQYPNPNPGVSSKQTPLHNNTTPLDSLENSPDQVPVLLLPTATMLSPMLPTTPTMLPAMLSPMLPTATMLRRPPRLRHLPNLPARQVHINPPRILLRRKLQPHLPTNLFHPRLDLLHASGGVVPLPHNNVQVRLAAGAGVAQPALEDVLGLFDKLAVQVDGVRGDVVDLVLWGC